jgi:hypothetical protein
LLSYLSREQNSSIGAIIISLSIPSIKLHHTSIILFMFIPQKKRDVLLKDDQFPRKSVKSIYLSRSLNCLCIYLYKWLQSQYRNSP